jgi:hypothetical protein
MSFDEWIVDRACVAVLGRYRVRRSEVYESRFVHLFWMEDGSVVSTSRCASGGSRTSASDA